MTLESLATPVAPDIDFSSGIPQSSTPPALLSFDPVPMEPEEDPALSQWRAESMATIQAAALDPDNAFGEEADFSFHPDPAHARKLAINDAFLSLHLPEGQDIPTDEMDRAILRSTLAERHFSGRGAKDEAEFFQAIQDQARSTVDSNAVLDHIAARAFETALFPEESTWAKTREAIRSLPGYDPGRDSDYLEAFLTARQEAADTYEPAKEPLRKLWQAMKMGGNAIGGSATASVTALDLANEIPDDLKPAVLDALRARARTMPAEERQSFLQALGQNTTRMLAGQAQQAGEELTGLGANITESIYADPLNPFHTQMVDRIPEIREAKKEFLKSRSFARQVEDIFTADYDKITSDSLLARAALAAPGVALSSFTMAVPLVGQAYMGASMKGYAADSLARRFEASGMDPLEAAEKADALSFPVAAAQLALEKVQFGMWANKLPRFSKFLDTIGDRIANRAARFTAKAAVITGAETAVEFAQDASEYLIQDAAAALSEDIPSIQWTGPGGVLEGAWSQYGEIALTMLPLSILGATGSMMGETRARAFQEADPLQLKALGLSEDAIQNIRDSAGPSSLTTNVSTAWESRTPDSPEAQAAAAELAQKEARRQAAQSILEGELRYTIPAITALPDGSYTVRDSITREIVATAPTWPKAVQAARAHSAAMDSLSGDNMVELASLLEAGTIAAKDSNIETTIDIGRILDRQLVAEELGPEAAERFAQEAALIEQAEGGTGQASLVAFGYNTTEQRATHRQDVARLHAGAHIGTVFHEQRHVLHRRARQSGVLTREDDIRLLRAFDRAFGQATTRAVKDEAGNTIAPARTLRFIPEGMTDDQIPETLLEEAIAEIAEAQAYLLKKGQNTNRFGLSRKIISRFIGAVGRSAPEPTNKLSHFVRAIRSRFGLALARAYHMKKAEARGDFDAKIELETYLDKLTGVDVQKEHDQAVADLATQEGYIDPADTPFSLGRMSISAAVNQARLELDQKVSARDQIQLTWELDNARQQEEGETFYYPTITLPKDDAYLEKFLPMEAISQEEDGKWYFGDSRAMDSLEEAQDHAFEVIRNKLKEIAPQSTFGSNADSQQIAGIIFDAFPSHPFIKKTWTPSKWGSWYLEFQDDNDTTRKISIRDHSATRADMGLPDKTFTVSKQWTPEEVGRALENAWEYIQENTPARSAIAEDMAGARETVSGRENPTTSPSSLPTENLPLATPDSVGFSLGRANAAAALSQDALRRIADPLRRIQAMKRISADFQRLSLQFQRTEALAGRRMSKRELRLAANAREEATLEAAIAEIHARFGSLLTDEDLTKLRAQPVHAFLADPTNRLRGHLVSRAQAIKNDPAIIDTGLYDGAELASRTLFGGTRMPDQAAQELYDEGLIPDPTPDSMWQALAKESSFVQSMRDLMSRAKDQIREARMEAKREANEWLATQSKDQETTYNPRQEILAQLRMLDAILLALPPEVRGAIGGHTQMAQIRQDKDIMSFLRDKLAKADVELEKFLRQQFDSELRDLLRRAAPANNSPGERPTGSIDADTYDILRHAESYMGKSFQEGEAEATKLEDLADHEDTTPEQALKLRAKAGLVRLFTDWLKAPAARREQAVIEATSLYFGGLSRLRDKQIRRNVRLAELRKAGISGTGKSGDRMQRKLAELTEKRTVPGRLKSYVWELISFGEVSRLIFGENNSLSQWLATRELAASNAYADALHAKTDALEAELTRLASSRFDGEKLRHKLQNESHITTTDAIGKAHTFTDTEAITFLLMWRQEDGRRHMEGQIDDSGNLSSSWGWTQQAATEIEAQLSPEGKSLLSYLALQYSTEYPRINAVFRRIWNVSMPSHKNYAPLTVAAQAGKDNQIVDPVTGEAMGFGMTPGSLKNRSLTAVAEPVFKDALQVYLNHTRQMEHFIAYGEFARDAMQAINRREIKNSIQAISPEAASTLSKWLEYFALGGLRDMATKGPINQAISSGMSRLSSAALVGRISVLSMQSLQLAAALYKMPVSAYLPRLAKLLTGNLDWSAHFQTPYIQRRMREMPPIVVDAIKGLSSATPTRLRHTAARLARTIPGADALFTSGTYAIFYDYHLAQARKQGIEDPEAYSHTQAEFLTDQVAQPVRPGARSWLELSQQGSPAFRALWNFSTDPRQKLGLFLYEALRHDKAGKAKASSMARTLLITYAASGIIQALLRAIMRDIRSGDDDEILDDRHWNPKRLALSAITGPIGGIPYFGGMAESALYKVAGVYNPEGTLLDSVSAGMIPAAKNIATGEWEDPLRDAEKLLTGLSFFSPDASALASASHILRDAWGLIDNFFLPDADQQDTTETTTPATRLDSR